MSAAVCHIRTRVVPATKNHSVGTIFMFHGSGDTGDGVRDWLNDLMGTKFCFPHLKVIYPTAPLRPYTPLGGRPSTVWFDRKNISPFVAEDPSLHDCCEDMSKLIEAEIQSGIPVNRIMLGGFSMGGCLALHLAYRYFPQVAGVVALSSFLNQESAVYEALKNTTSSFPPLLQCHGQKDDLVQYEWGENTCKKLKDHGIKVDFESYPNLYHQMNKKEVYRFKEWVENILPDS